LRSELRKCFSCDAQGSMYTDSRILILVPNIFGHSGDAVNERQLIKSLCKNNGCLIISFIKIYELFKLKKYLSYLRWELPSHVLLIPVAIPHPTTIFSLLVTVLATPLIWIIDKFVNFKFIYIRSSNLSVGILAIKSLSEKTCVKLAETEDVDLRWRKILSLIYTLTDRIALAKSGIIGVPSPILLKEIVERRRVLPSGKIVMIPAGVDKEKIEAIRRKAVQYSKNKGAYTIGFIGLLAWWQGVDLLVKAVAKLKKVLDKSLTLLIVGDGYERKKIELLCSELKINCHITGFVSHKEALRHLLSSDILAVPSIKISTTESNIPIKVIEAWALGVPVITTRHKIYEYLGLRDGEHIMYCKPSPDDIASKILVILTDEELRMKLSKNGPLLARKFYYEDIAFRLLGATTK